MNPILNELYRQALGFYTPTKEDAGKVFTKSSIIPQEDGYRASVSYFVDGNTYSVIDVKPTLKEAEDFIQDRVKRGYPTR